MFQKLYVPEILGVGVRVGVGRLGVGALAGGVAAGVAVGEVVVLKVANNSCRGLGRAQRLPYVSFGLLMFSSFLVLGLEFIGCCRLEGGVCVTFFQIPELEHFMEHFSR